jgi:hypothetical protein
VDALETLLREIAPPVSARDATVARLRQEGLLPGASASSVTAAWQPAPVARRLVELAAVALAAFVLGRFWPSDTAPVLPATRPEFVLLLYGAESPPEAEAARVTEYGAWARELAQTGRRVAGERLGDASWVAGSRPTGPAHDPILGYFVVEAEDEREAVGLAEHHPHVRHGGWIEVRPIGSR